MTVYNQNWRGDAPAVAQVNTITPASVTIGNTFTVTINGKSVTYTAAAATVADVVTNMTMLLAACTFPEFQEVTWSANGTTDILATAATAGVPFIQTSSAATGSGSSGNTLTTATPTASGGPADVSTPANYSLGQLPASGDTLNITVTGNPLLYNLQALSGVTLAVGNIDMSFTGSGAAGQASIGLPRNNPKGYVEYRQRHLQLPATVWNIGQGPGGGAGRLAIDNGSVQTTLNVFNSATNPSDAGLQVIQFKGTNASNVVNISRGSFSAAYLEGELATIATLNQGYQTNQQSDTSVVLGAGCTLTTINKSGGSLTTYASFTTLNQGPSTAGTTTIAAGTPGAINCSGGMIIYRAVANYTAIVVGEVGVVDFRQCIAAPGGVTGTNTTINYGATFLDPAQCVTFTNPMQLNCRLADITLDLGYNFTLQR